MKLLDDSKLAFWVFMVSLFAVVIIILAGGLASLVSQNGDLKISLAVTKSQLADAKSTKTSCEQRLKASQQETKKVIEETQTMRTWLMNRFEEELKENSALKAWIETEL